MAPRKTTEQFISDAKRVHGDKYDYSKVIYVKNNIKVAITCKEHGVFEQEPGSHLKGNGCSKCSGTYSCSTEEWIEKAKKVHGNTYDYSKVVYNGAFAKVHIICKEHGTFQQTASAHLNGQRCSKCAKCYRPTTEDWIEKAREVHSHKYDYSKVEYKTNKIKVTIICNEHGEFTQEPGSHLKGYGCKKCVGCYNYTTQEWIEKAKEVHGDTYDYSKVEYKNAFVKVFITCKEHGKFQQVPNTHLQGYGCSKCSRKSSYTTEEWVAKAKEAHRDTYDYSKVEYKTNKVKVCIVCKKHGLFYQTPNSHLNGKNGCPTCSKASFSKIQIEWLNSISSNIKHALNGGEFKIPKTRYRADGYDAKTNTIYELNGDYFHGNPKFYDAEEINEVTKTKFGVLFKKTLHKEMIIRNLGYNYVCIWEHEFRKLKR